MQQPKLSEAAAIVATLFVGQSVQAQDAELPSSMIWTSYDLGAAGYVEASAIADALDKTFDTRVRITPSGTGIGRLLPLQTGRASYGFMGNEIYFAGEALYEFAAREWGPQDLRVLLGRPASVGLVTGGDTEFMTPADLAGAKIGFVQANPSTTMNTLAVLAFAGLTADDVEQVVYPSYGAMAKAFTAGEVDVAPAIPVSSFLREAEGGRGVRWMDMPASDTEGWERVKARADLFAPSTATVGVSISADDPAELVGYRYPQLTVTADADADEVYNMIKALDQSFSAYKDATPVIARWAVQTAGTTPASVPFHEGAIRYLTEIGVWTDTDQTWNDARIERNAAVQAAWNAAIDLADVEGVSSKNWPDFWATYRAENLD
ncbi:TAXI family TRAP transporter solute-binding subunit [Phaeobacter sp. C3_T13_0]|uniref:TAXI family TRAP transporter solute-binding subunit n=1 Tax=Phaeobacter cretensis TaxID=3342641 RepID=UPI0039BC9260